MAERGMENNGTDSDGVIKVRKCYRTDIGALIGRCSGLGEIRISCPEFVARSVLLVSNKR